MHLINRTSEQADALWGVSGKNEMGAAVIVKGTYDVTRDGTLSPTAGTPWPVQRENLETPWGLFLTDLTPVSKPRCDLLVCATARSRLRRPVEQMDVTIAAGSATPVVVRVIGDRVWERRCRRLVPSAPAPFVEMPMTMDHAFGGTVTIEWGDLPCQDNPTGRGYALEEAQAEGMPLPNLEDPADPILRWDDRPAPLAPCVYPPAGALRVRLIPEDAKSPLEYDHLFLNQAHPRLMLEAPPSPGEVVRVDGIRHDGPFIATVPACPATAHVRCDAEVTPIALRLDTIVVLGDEDRVVFRWRGGTRFPLRPREHREVVVEAAREHERSA